MKHIKTPSGGFALPTVLIASIVMLMIMTVSVTSVVSVRTALKSQYYEQLAKAAGEAGVAYAKACLAKNGNVPLWTDAKPLTPATDCAGNQMLTPQIQVLVTAGGGGGGGSIGGGGGGGGVVYDDSFAVTPQAYSVTVGAGGAGGAGAGSTGASGVDSTFGALTAKGGGGGGSRSGTNAMTPATSGGSGGGGTGTINTSTGLPAVGAAGTVGQGNKGGDGSSGTTGSAAGNGGGGGGAGVAGGNASGMAMNEGYSGAGGNGFLSDISGSIFFYGGGGSGGRWGTGTIGMPGLTGAGTGAGTAAASSGSSAGPNTGGGGGGGSSSSGPGGNGGSGVVIVRYPTNNSVTATASNVTPTIEGSYKVFRFNATGTFTVSAVASSSCPTDPRCSVLDNGTVRSSFSVMKPALNSEGEAVAIPNSGYVELLRTSTGLVWKTYRQPSVQAAAVPDFCSGQATTALGWSNAVAASDQQQIAGASSAKSITLANGDLIGGSIYFKKDFPVTVAGTYTLTVRTTSDDGIVTRVNGGTTVLAGGWAAASYPVTLTAGCNTVAVQLTNQTLTPKPSSFVLSIQQTGGTPIVGTDTSWRATAGMPTHFSMSDYDTDPKIWKPALNVSAATAASAAWTAAANDANARYLSAPATTGCSASCPADSHMYYRDDTTFTLTTPNLRVKLSAICDSACTIYIDGNPVLNGSGLAAVNQQTLSLAAGTYRLAARVANNSVGASGIAASVTNVTTSAVIANTKAGWVASNLYTSVASPAEIFGYEKSFRPSPDDFL